MRTWLMAGAAVVGLGVGAARADVVFHIQSTGSAPFPVTVMGDVIVDQAAADAGFNYISRVGGPNPVIPQSPTLFEAGLHGLFLNFNVTNFAGYGVSFGDFAQQLRLSNALYALTLSGSTATGLFGSVVATNGEDRYFQLFLSGFTASGTVGVDGPGGPCTISRTACSYTAAVTVTQKVPEPASLALLGAGLVGLAAARRRHAA